MIFTPIITDQIKSFLQNKDYLYSLINTFKRPLNLIFLNEIKNNISKFTDVLKKYNIKSSIYYAHKCNKSSAIVKEVLNEGINIDVASEKELQHVLSCGFTGDKIEATGPKNDLFIILGLRHNIIFNVDNISELETIIKYHKQINKQEKTKILFRLNDFSSTENKFIKKQSRFGTPIKSVKEILKIIKDNSNYINCIGFAFHLDTVNLKEKAIAIENSIGLFNIAYDMGLNPYILNIGGGFKVNYLKNKEDWDTGISQIKENTLSNSGRLTWNNASFGLRAENGTLKGALNIYNYYEPIAKEKFLDEILSYKSEKFQNRTIGNILSENMIELMIEPGRSLLDDVGINIAQVTYTKLSANNDLMIGLDINRSNILLGEQEMLIDPILISQSTKKEKNSAYLIGNLCLESDFIFKRKISFNQIPQKDDLIVFINTAGYFMDFSESNTIMQNTAVKLVMLEKQDKFEYILDSNYDPIIDMGRVK